eukprot:COSAG02_NODE_33872_length_493_cov_0.619289_1_plen_61_part_10
MFEVECESVRCAPGRIFGVLSKQMPNHGIYFVVASSFKQPELSLMEIDINSYRLSWNTTRF